MKSFYGTFKIQINKSMLVEIFFFTSEMILFLNTCPLLKEQYILFWKIENIREQNKANKQKGKTKALSY